ncbi:MAG: host attachment protein [Sphingomonadales bacterium]|nr:host attachment protein [Sphingomonadales bacterium]
MLLPHKTEVCVADGRKLLLLVNEGDAKFPDLQVIRVEEQDNPPDRVQSTDRPGRSFNSMSNHRSAYAETDFQQLAEDRFAADAADILRKRALANRFDKLVVIAPPSTLGEMRKKYHKEVEARIVGEIAKEATNLPPEGIAAMIDAA